ncbi:MAG: AraC family transcriptional regulator [Campylobacterota bacterium]|nr:AraC family transcriptional regulator [Campylobacterota bacterium]
MHYNIYEPSHELATIVRKYFVITDVNVIESMLFLPNGGNFLIFNRGIKGFTKLHTGEAHDILQGYSIGMKASKAKRITLDKNNNFNNMPLPIILVELLPIGYYKLFHKDASILTKGHISIENDIIDVYFSKLYTHDTLEEEIEYLNRSLKEMDIANNNIHLLVEGIVDSIINKHHFEVTVEELMLEFNYTRKTMERQFKKTIGLTPKNFIYVAKFCKTFLKYVEEAKKLKDIEYLYSDNAHFNVVFQNITGFSPSELFNDVVNHNDIQIYQMKQTRSK